MLIVDGNPAAYQAGAPQGTSESKHLFTQKRSAAATDLLFDGKPVMRANGFVVYIPPLGDMLVIAVTVATNGVSRSFLVLNGKKVPGSDTVDRGSTATVPFSPSAKHYAPPSASIYTHH